MENWIEESVHGGKPSISWIDSYVQGDGTFVDGHFRTHQNQELSDNLSSDVDGDGIPGFFDADADGDGLTESLDLDNNGIVDTIDVDNDGMVDLIVNLLAG